MHNTHVPYEFTILIDFWLLLIMRYSRDDKVCLLKFLWLECYKVLSDVQWSMSINCNMLCCCWMQYYLMAKIKLNELRWMFWHSWFSIWTINWKWRRFENLKDGMKLEGGMKLIYWIWKLKFKVRLYLY